MNLTDPTDIPSLISVFGRNAGLMQAFRLAYVTSPVPVMLLPRQVLTEFDGIGERTSLYITHALREAGLPHLTFGENACDFMDAHFGSIEDAPVMALSVVSLRDAVASRPYFAPLQMLHLLSEIAPHFTVRSLLTTTKDGLMEMVEEHVTFGPRMERLEHDLREINWRLSWWNEQFVIGGLSSTRRLGQLSLISLDK